MTHVAGEDEFVNAQGLNIEELTAAAKEKGWNIVAAASGKRPFTNHGYAMKPYLVLL